MTSEQLMLNGTQPTMLALTPNYSWIDDTPIFNNEFDIKHDEHSKKPHEHIHKFISASLLINLVSTTPISTMRSTTNKLHLSTASFGVNTFANTATNPLLTKAIGTTESVTNSHSTTASSNKSIPALSQIHHVASFGLNETKANPLSIKSSGSVAKPIGAGDVLPTPQGFMNTPQGMVAMSWDDIRKQALNVIPSNVLQHKVNCIHNFIFIVISVSPFNIIVLMFRWIQTRNWESCKKVLR